MTAPPVVDAPLALVLEGVSRKFGATVALEDASFQLRAGSVHALLGENGAGKTTLMRIAYGMVRPDAGVLSVNGDRARLASAADAMARGIGMVHQHFTLVPAMTVAENIALGGRGMLDLAGVAQRTRDIAARTGFTLDPAARVESLTVGAQQRVEIAKALVRNARILILDEPTAVLAPMEAAELLRWLRSYADAGNAVVLITHKLREALRIADDVTVLRRGRTVLQARRTDVGEESLTAAMIGDAATIIARPERVATMNARRLVAFRADRVSIVDDHGVARIRDATFQIDAGDIVGIAAVEGSGQHELLRALAGRMAIASGSLTLPADVGFVPEDRHHDAVLLDRSLTENVALRGAGERRGLMDWTAIEALTDGLIQTFDVRATSSHVAMRTLSGGNQQKLVLARELTLLEDSPSARAIVTENPTRGLDVRATSDVHARLLNASAEGNAIVLFLSDIDEILLLATRVLVVHAGTVSEVPLDRDAIGRAMLGSI